MRQVRGWNQEHAQARGAYVLDGRRGMLLFGCSEHCIARGVDLLAGADVWGAQEDLVATVVALESHCIHNSLQHNELG